MLCRLGGEGCWRAEVTPSNLSHLVQPAGNIMNQTLYLVVVGSVGSGGELQAVLAEVARLQPRPCVEHQQFPGLGTLQFLGRSALV